METKETQFHRPDLKRVVRGFIKNIDLEEVAWIILITMGVYVAIPLFDADIRFRDPTFYLKFVAVFLVFITFYFFPVSFLIYMFNLYKLSISGKPAWRPGEGKPLVFFLAILIIVYLTGNLFMVFFVPFSNPEQKMAMYLVGVKLAALHAVQFGFTFMLIHFQEWINPGKGEACQERTTNADIAVSLLFHIGVWFPETVWKSIVSTAIKVNSNKKDQDKVESETSNV